MVLQQVIGKIIDHHYFSINDNVLLLLSKHFKKIIQWLMLHCPTHVVNESNALHGSV